MSETTEAIMPAERDDARRTTFGARLREAREARRRTQEDVADAMGVTQTSISGWEKARSTPGPDEVFELERLLDLPPGTLSHTLGFLPVGGGVECTVETALENDPFLTDLTRAAVLNVYRSLMGFR